MLQIPLLQPVSYQLYKLQPFPIKQQDKIFVYIETMKDFIFTDAMRQKYGKLSYPELQTCFRPNELTYVCKETLPIITYLPNEECEATLIHPSTIVISNYLCEQRLLSLEFTYWIPLHLSNEWLYVAPKTEIFTVLCGNEKFQLTLQDRGLLSLPPRCKGYSTHTTLYVLSTLAHNNSKEDVLPLAPVNIDCCLTNYEKEQLHEISLQKPLTNILSSVEDLNLASIKIDEIQDLIDKEQAKRFEHFKVVSTTWGTVILTIILFSICICCSCCCCKCCRQCAFWLWDKWTPKECIRHTKERCCVITNINADRVLYSEIPQTPPSTPMSVRSLPLVLQEPQPSPSKVPEPRRRSATKASESWEWLAFQKATKVKESKGER